MTEQAMNNTDFEHQTSLSPASGQSHNSDARKQEATIEQWQPSHEQADECSPEGRQDRKASILGRLKLYGIKEVVAHYSGYGDEGGIDEIEITEPEEKWNLLDGAHHSAYENRESAGLHQLAMDIETLCLEELEAHAGGWEINDGSDGIFTFDVEAGAVTCSHNKYHRESDDYTWEV